MPTDAEITFADHMGRFYARRFSFPPMVGRLIGYLAVCDPPNPTIGELAEALLASRSAIAGAVKILETIHAGPALARRRRADGPRSHRPAQQSMRMDVSEYEEMRELAREGLEVLSDAPPERRAALLEMSAFADFLVEQMPRLSRSGRRGAEALVASGDLPESALATGGDHDRLTSTRRRRRPACASRSATTVVLDGVDLDGRPRERSSRSSARTEPARRRWCGSSPR